MPSHLLQSCITRTSHSPCACATGFAGFLLFTITTFVMFSETLFRVKLEMTSQRKMTSQLEFSTQLSCGIARVRHHQKQRHNRQWIALCLSFVMFMSKPMRYFKVFLLTSILIQYSNTLLRLFGEILFNLVMMYSPPNLCL